MAILQRRAHAAGHLSDAIAGQQRVNPARKPASLRVCCLEAWTDAMHKLRPTGPLWTFWDYKFERWEKDKGMRLDRFLLPPKMSDRLVDRSVDRWVRGEVNASDHAPVWIKLDV